MFPELLLTGYPPEDLLLKPHFLDACEEALEALAAAGRGDRRAGRLPRARDARPPQRRSPCSPTADRRAVYRKVHLPNYGVFDERRYFEPGTESAS